METEHQGDLGLTNCQVYSEVEPFEGWKHKKGLMGILLIFDVYSEVEPFEGWKLATVVGCCQHQA